MLMALGYMWDNTVVARRRRLAEEERTEIREKALEEGRAEGQAEVRAELEDGQAENARLKARIAELERQRNADAE